jgi:hypothetical protein
LLSVIVFTVQELLRTLKKINKMIPNMRAAKNYYNIIINFKLYLVI